jgi:hypothetical protein
MRSWFASPMDHARNRGAVLAGIALLACALAGPCAFAQSAQQPSNAAAQTPPQPANPVQAPVPQPKPAKSVKTTSAPSKSAGRPTRYLPNRFAGRAGAYYRVVWGIDSPSVKWTESGEMIRFSWRVLDAEKAKALNDKKSEPSLIDPKAGVSLVVPSMENIGQLRQSVLPEVGKSYWLAFSNKGRLVKRGDRVIVAIGAFRADGLVVD